MRVDRQDKQQSNGKRMFESDELRKIIDGAKQPLRAMTLLGSNCGFGQTDVARLPLSAVDLKAGWIDYRKTELVRESSCRRA